MATPWWRPGPAWLGDHTLVLIRWASVAIILVGAALSIYYVIRIGHVGAEAALNRVSRP